MKIWPYEVVQVKRGEVDARNPCATLDEARQRAGRFWDAIVKNRTASEWHPDVARPSRKIIETWLLQRPAPTPLGEVDDTPPAAEPVPLAPIAPRPHAPEPSESAPGLLQPEGVCAVCGDVPQRCKPSLPEALRPLCRRHRTLAQGHRTTRGLSPEDAFKAVVRADAPPSRVIEVPRVVYTPAEPEPTEPTPVAPTETYPPTAVREVPSAVPGLTRVLLGGVPVWGTLVAPGVVEVTGIRLALESSP